MPRSSVVIGIENTKVLSRTVYLLVHARVHRGVGGTSSTMQSYNPFFLWFTSDIK